MKYANIVGLTLTVAANTDIIEEVARLRKRADQLEHCPHDIYLSFNSSDVTIICRTCKYEWRE